jgi:cysteine desulfurase
MQKPIYLDNNATTPCAPEVVDAMLPYFTQQCGNPSSIHSLGLQAQLAVTKARESMASFLGCDSSEIFFTSGATESNNQVLLTCPSADERRRGVIVSAVEHKSVLVPAQALSELGIAVQKLPVDAGGRVLLESLKDIVNESIYLVSVQAANNEVGTLQPIQEIAEYAHSQGVLVHCDATQLLGRKSFDLYELGVDYASFSAHKVYGPKGVGALFVRQGNPRRNLSPLLRGGGQEASLRAGTLNVPGIVGFAAACSVAQNRIAPDTLKLTQLRDNLEKTMLESITEATVNGDLINRLPGTTSITIPGVQAETLIANIPNICISGGSACSEGTVSPSHVLIAMGLSRERAECTVRIGIGRYNSQTEIDLACTSLVAVVEKLRNASGESCENEERKTQ